MSEWYYAQGNQRFGPEQLEKLKEMVAAGQLHPGDLVWTAGMVQWVAAGSVEALFPAGAAGELPVAQIATSLDTLAAAGAERDAARAAAGLPQMDHFRQVTHKQLVGSAMTGMIVSIVGIAFCGWILAPVGLILSLNARKKLKQAGIVEGQGMALAGIIIGISVIVLYVSVLIFFIMLRSR